MVLADRVDKVRDLVQGWAIVKAVFGDTIRACVVEDAKLGGNILFV